jgi:hypothetical protein
MDAASQAESAQRSSAYEPWATLGRGCGSCSLRLVLASINRGWVRSGRVWRASGWSPVPVRQLIAVEQPARSSSSPGPSDAAPLPAPPPSPDEIQTSSAASAPTPSLPAGHTPPTAVRRTRGLGDPQRRRPERRQPRSGPLGERADLPRLAAHRHRLGSTRGGDSQVRPEPRGQCRPRREHPCLRRTPRRHIWDAEVQICRAAAGRRRYVPARIALIACTTLMTLLAMLAVAVLI